HRVDSATSTSVFTLTQKSTSQSLTYQIDKDKEKILAEIAAANISPALTGLKLRQIVEGRTKTYSISPETGLGMDAAKPTLLVQLPSTLLHDMRRRMTEGPLLAFRWLDRDPTKPCIPASIVEPASIVRFKVKAALDDAAPTNMIEILGTDERERRLLEDVLAKADRVSSVELWVTNEAILDQLKIEGF